MLEIIPPCKSFQKNFVKHIYIFVFLYFCFFFFPIVFAFLFCLRPSLLFQQKWFVIIQRFKHLRCKQDPQIKSLGYKQFSKMFYQHPNKSIIFSAKIDKVLVWLEVSLKMKFSRENKNKKE